MSPFEFDGEKYKAGSAHQKEWGNKVIEELSRSLCGDETVLDLGCGDEVLTKQCTNSTRGRVIGIDASIGMISAAQREPSRGVEFLHQNIIDIDYIDEFDVIYSNATLHWIHDHSRLLRSCHRALKKDGLLRFNFAGYGNCANLEEVLRKHMSDPEFQEDFHSFSWPWYMPTTEEYSELCKGSAFRDLRVWLDNADRLFGDESEMIRWIDQPSLVPFLAGIEDTRHKEEFRRRVIDSMLKVAKGADGRCFEYFRRINVFARK